MAGEICECGCGYEADNVVAAMSSTELAGARYRLACADGKLFGRIRARRATIKQPPVLKFYGMQPAVLPDTLPNGTLLVDEGGKLSGWKVNGAKLEHGLYVAELNECSGPICGRARFVPCRIDWASVPVQEGADVTPIRTQAEANAVWGEGSPIAELCGAVLAPQPEKTVTCRDCGALATHPQECSRKLTLCIYCAQREHESTRREMPGNPLENRAARSRMLDAERREAPRVTKQSLEEAKPHPWEAWANPGDES